MLMDRIIGAFTFRKEVYAEVEQDTSFTTTAWLIVAVVSFLSTFGTRGATLFERLGSGVIGSIITLISFAIGALVISWLGRTLFKAEVSFEELVRTLGLAYVWNVVGFFGILGAIPGLNCLVGIGSLAAAIAGLVSWFIAAKEALDLDWVETIVTVIVGWIVIFLGSLAAGAVIGLLGWGVETTRGIFGF